MKRQAPAFLSLTLLLVGALSGAAHADVNLFAVSDFTADYYLSTSDPQGTMSIHEHLLVNFSDNNHGILRALPQKYNGQNQHLKIADVKRDGVKEPYSTYGSNGNTVLKIGSANTTVTGSHSYDISYSVQNVMRFAPSHDDLVWNTNGTEWGQPFGRITARLHVPAAFAARLSSPKCFTGGQGSTAHDCTVSVRGTETTFVSSRALLPGENMTFSANFPKGIFHQPTAADWWHDNGAKVAAILVPSLLAFGVAYRKWHKDGKDIKGRGTIIPEYGPPEGLRAAEADVINHYKLGKNAISATIIDLAIRKYLKIIEGQDNGILGIGKHKTYTLQKLPSPPSDTLKPYEQQIYDGLFPNGDTTEIASLKNKFYTTSAAVRKNVPDNLTQEGYFPGKPGTAGFRLYGAAILFFALSVLLRNYVSVGLAIGGLVFLAFAALMPKRTQKGVEAKDMLAGLKMYMETAEKDRMAMLQSAEAPYTERSAEPTHTVELFEKLLPYAMVMGVEQSWAKQFEGIYTTPPDWYSGNWTAFNTGYLVGSLNDSISAMNSSFAAPSSSGSGSGGSFSGGGGGGGGGGGW